MGGARTSRVVGGLCAAIAVFVCAIAMLASRAATAAPDSSANGGVHEGVASCAGSTCHSRQVDSGPVVQQNELITWQDRSSPAGAHSRAWQVLRLPRAQAITAKLGYGPAEKAKECLSCHAEPAGATGPKFLVSDGVGCESCHGPSSAWLASHYTVDGNHQANLAKGMRKLEDPKVRADVCLDCHFGSDKPYQFVTHKIMAAGHPRVSFELDLFSSLQQHWRADAKYAARKQPAGPVKTWAVGQAMAVDRALTLYGQRSGGAFPEFYFFDCHSCHRRISDEPDARPAWRENPGRPIDAGQPPFNDENMIMLSAAARVVDPPLAARLAGDSRAFHEAMRVDRGATQQAARRLAATARQLADAFAREDFSEAETLAIIDSIVANETSRRYTDYTGSAQAVMAVDTLATALGIRNRVRGSLNNAYAQVRDPNSYRPDAFRASLNQVAQAARSRR